MEWRVPLADLDYGPEEESAVLDVLRSRWLTMGASPKHLSVNLPRWQEPGTRWRCLTPPWRCI